MTDTFDTDIAKCNLFLDKISRTTGLEIGMSVNPTIKVLDDWRDLNTANARLMAEKEVLKRENNKLKRLIAKINLKGVCITMDTNKWSKIKSGRWCVSHKEDEVHFEILFNVERDCDGLKEIIVTDVAKFSGGVCVVLSEDEVEVNHEYYKDIVASDLRDEDEYDRSIAATDVSVYGNGGLC